MKRWRVWLHDKRSIQGGAELERARIVAWLRLFVGNQENVFHDIADALERGEHRTPGDP